MDYYYVGFELPDINKKLTVKDYLSCIEPGNTPLRIFKKREDAVKVALDGATQFGQEQWPIFKVSFEGKGKRSSYVSDDKKLRVVGLAVDLRELKFIEASLSHIDEKRFKPVDVRRPSLLSYVVKPALVITGTAAAWYFGGVDLVANNISSVLPSLMSASTQALGLISLGSFALVAGADRGIEAVRSRRQVKSEKAPEQTVSTETNNKIVAVTDTLAASVVKKEKLSSKDKRPSSEPSSSRLLLSDEVIDLSSDDDDKKEKSAHSDKSANLSAQESVHSDSNSAQPTGTRKRANYR